MRTEPRTDCPTTLPDLPEPTPEEILEQAMLPVNDLSCSYLKMFPGSNKNCAITQKECYEYTIQLAEAELLRLEKSFQ